METENVSVSLVNCCKCGRVLKKPASIEKGIGPVCAKRLFAEGQTEIVETFGVDYESNSFNFDHVSPVGV